MINFQLTIDGSGVLKAANALEKALLSAETMGRVLEYASAAIWIPLIQNRLERHTGTSGYESELDVTMYDLDPTFAAKYTPSGGWSTEAERRIPGGYQRGEITKSIEKAIQPSPPIVGKGYIAVGIGNIDMLNALAPAIGDTEWKIWQVIHWGTGEFNPKSRKAVVRSKPQTFYDARNKKGKTVKTTTNPGFQGRQFFVQFDGDIHRADYSVELYVMAYMAKMTKKYSYRK